MASRSAKVMWAQAMASRTTGTMLAEVLAAGELGDDPAVEGVEVDLAGDDGGESLGAVADDGSGGLVAGGLDAEDEAGG